MDYLDSDFIFLEGLFTNMIIDVVWCEPVSSAMYTTMNKTLNE